jgi:hypothetical protein
MTISRLHPTPNIVSTQELSKPTWISTAGSKSTRNNTHNTRAMSPPARINREQGHIDMDDTLPSRGMSLLQRIGVILLALILLRAFGLPSIWLFALFLVGLIYLILGPICERLLRFSVEKSSSGSNACNRATTGTTVPPRRLHASSRSYLIKRFATSCNARSVAWMKLAVVNSTSAIAPSSSMWTEANTSGTSIPPLALW